MQCNMLIYSILRLHHRLSFGLLTRSTTPLLIDHKWSALLEPHKRKSLIFNDIDAQSSTRSQAEATLGSAPCPIRIR
jgi:hypothetical protein